MLAAAFALFQPAPPRRYEDPAGRFAFTYPAAFGTTAPGTNNGFEGRAASVRFSSFPAAYGGEAVLTRGFPLIDLQAVGGLYDSITLEIFPAPLRAAVLAHLPRLGLDNFCAALGELRHVDPALPAFGSLGPQQQQAIAAVDVMRNAEVRVIECRTVGDTVVFDKERAVQPGFPRQHVYGAVRFLPEPWSTFQLVAGGEPPDRASLGAIEALVRSLTLR